MLRWPRRRAWVVSSTSFVRDKGRESCRTEACAPRANRGEGMSERRGVIDAAGITAMIGMPGNRSTIPPRVLLRYPRSPLRSFHGRISRITRAQWHIHGLASRSVHGSCLYTHIIHIRLVLVCSWKLRHFLVTPRTGPSSRKTAPVVVLCTTRIRLLYIKIIATAFCSITLIGYSHSCAPYREISAR